MTPALQVWNVCISVKVCAAFRKRTNVELSKDKMNDHSTLFNPQSGPFQVSISSTLGCLNCPPCSHKSCSMAKMDHFHPGTSVRVPIIWDSWIHKAWVFFLLSVCENVIRKKNGGVSHRAKYWSCLPVRFKFSFFLSDLNGSFMKSQFG